MDTDNETATPEVGRSGRGRSGRRGGCDTRQDLAAELEKTRAALKAANAESAARRKKLEAFEASGDELTRLKAEVAEAKAATQAAQAQVRQTAIRFAVELEAGRLNFQDPADALTLADLTAVQVDDAGTVTGASEAVKAWPTSAPTCSSLPATPWAPPGAPRPRNPSGAGQARRSLVRL